VKYQPPVSPEEKRFCALIADRIRQSEQSGRAVFTGFLNLREQELARQTAGKLCAGVTFFGGYENAERVMLGAGECTEADFPLCAVCFAVYGEFDHRDALGSILALGLSRDPIGDIIKTENGFCVFVSSAVAPFLRTELTRVGRAAAKSCEGEAPAFTAQTEEHSDTVASVRLDSIVAAVANISRADAVELITRGLVSVNHCVTEKVTLSPEAGDVLSVRGHGKFCLDSLDGVSRKGRIILRYRKYL